MSGIDWDPPALAAVIVGLTTLAAWLALAPPARSARGAVRILAALLLAFALLDVGCRRPAGGSTPRLVLLVDRSLSMRAAGRDEDARAWLARLDEVLGGWRVERDSFGGATTDLADAIERAEARLPEAIVLVSDGRAAGGRAAEPPAVRLYAYAPMPLAIEDLAILDVAVVEEEGGGVVAEVEVAAVGGLPAPGRGVTVRVDGQLAGRSPMGERLAAGERRAVRVPLARGVARAVVEARLEGADAATGNDRRARVTAPGSGPRVALLVGLRPSWEFGFVRRALDAAGAAPVESYWAPGPGRLAPLDRPGAASWSGLSPDRFRTAWLFGDPALLGEVGRAWIERFVARGGRGVLWAPAGHAGSLPGGGGVAAGGRASGPPALTAAGSRWLVAHGGPRPPGPAPDGTAAWPPLELLPPGPPELPGGAVPLFVAAGLPVAWVTERSSGRAAVLLGTGYYRWRLADEPGPRAFWDGWIATLARWLAGASSAERPLVRLPPGGRVAPGDPLEAMAAATGELAWRVERPRGEDGVAAVVARGDLEAGDGATRVLRAGPFEPGVYRLVAEAGGRRTVEPFVVETWAPDLAWTAADTGSLAQAARASGGVLLGADPRIPRPDRGFQARTAGRALGLGTTPWLYFAVVLLLLLDWGLRPRHR